MLRFIFMALVLASCSPRLSSPSPEKGNKAAQSADHLLETIALGSCHKRNLPQPHWAHIQAQQPDLWIWMGDIIYGDSPKPSVLNRKYTELSAIPGYAALCAEVPVVGIWDDHDYGVNDGDKNYGARAESKVELFNFLGVPKTNPAWQREGAYQSYTFGPKGKQVAVILLDARYFRDPLQKDTEGKARYRPNSDGTVLGDAQWAWLSETLDNSTADVHLIVSGVQVLPEEHYYEKWANFPQERQRLLDLLAQKKPENALLLSGDRHISEVSKTDLPGYGPLYEFTSSGITHTWSRPGEESNRYRVGQLQIDKSFGLIRIDWSGKEPVIRLEARQSETGAVLAEWGVE